MLIFVFFNFLALKNSILSVYIFFLLLESCICFSLLTVTHAVFLLQP